MVILYNGLLLINYSTHTHTHTHTHTNTHTHTHTRTHTHTQHSATIEATNAKARSKEWKPLFNIYPEFMVSQNLKAPTSSPQCGQVQYMLTTCVLIRVAYRREGRLGFLYPHLPPPPSRFSPTPPPRKKSCMQPCSL